MKRIENKSMKRFGSTSEDMAETSPDQVFELRLNLLIIMVKAALKGYPAGRHRRSAVLENAARLHKMAADLDLNEFIVTRSTHLFKERVKLLCIMATAIISDEYPLGIHRREAVFDNIDTLCEQSFFNQQVKHFHDILKVA